MVKKIVINCDFGGSKQPTNFYIGEGAFEKNPIGFQSKWLSENRGGAVPENMMKTLEKIKKVSDQHSIPFEELYEYLVDEIESGRELLEINVDNKNKIEEVKKQQALENEASSDDKKEEVSEDEQE